MTSVFSRKFYDVASVARNGVGNYLPQVLTPIQSFYCGKNVFITGATGFMGKILLEKLLHACPDIGTIYILGRSKRGKALEARLDELFALPVFSRVVSDVPGFREKIKIIEGDISKPCLGLTNSDKTQIIDKVNVVFHVAATVKFNQPLKVATATNLRPTRDLLLLSKDMKDLKSFVYVSTALSQPFRDVLDEQFCQSPLDPLNVIDFTETANPDLLQDVTARLYGHSIAKHQSHEKIDKDGYLGESPSTYSFTKSLAEDTVRQLGVGLPTAIFRPSAVISSYKEPLPRWVDNYNAFTAYYFYAGQGLLKVIKLGKPINFNIVPVDMCINALIASAWEVAEQFDKRKLEKKNLSSDDIKIYNYVLADNPINGCESFDLMLKDGSLYPSSTSTIGYHTPIWRVTSDIAHRVLKILFHRIPALFSDTLLFCTGRKPRYNKMYDQFDNYEAAVEVFVNRQWKLKNNNIKQLIDNMDAKDRQLFSCDVRNINWHDYFNTMFLGMRRHLLKEDDSTLEEAKKRYARLYIQNRLGYLFVLLLIVGGAYGVTRIGNYRTKKENPENSILAKHPNANNESN